MEKTRFPNLQRLVLLKSASTLAISLKALAIVIPVLVFYYQDLSIVFSNAFQNEATNYVVLIPFLFVYFMYRKRKMLRATIPHQSSNQPRNTRHLATLSGMLLCATAAILYWYGSYTFTPLEYHMLTLPVFAAGLILALFGPQTLRQLLFSVAFLIFLTPPPLGILYDLGSTLSVIGSEVSNAIVNAFGISSRISSEYANPTIIITRPDKTTMGFTLDLACSGIYPSSDSSCSPP